MLVRFLILCLGFWEIIGKERISFLEGDLLKFYSIYVGVLYV